MPTHETPELPDYQQLIHARELIPGDYLYRSLPQLIVGPRGGRTRVRPARFEARVRSFDPHTGLLILTDAGRPEWPLRLRWDVPVVIKRRDTPGGSQELTSDDLLARAAELDALGQTLEANRLLAQAEAKALEETTTHTEETR